MKKVKSVVKNKPVSRRKAMGALNEAFNAWRAWEGNQPPEERDSFLEMVLEQERMIKYYIFDLEMGLSQ